ncbi:uncharacterized protein LOC131945084 [Physella acuta]|uniref:uncharacterized protein LOC131945084 n=1 Tax=Physella acuta TaxID=109671 RepID=UPI0027DB85F5|nr:uncharacterized protein LOC131945084 [Physella acuta]
MKAHSFVLIFAILNNLNSETASASVQFDAQPNIILPSLSKSLQIRCSIQNASSSSTSYLLTTLMPPTTQMTAASTQITGPVQGPDVSYLLSLVIVKVNKATGENETVASVAGCLAATTEDSFTGKVKVEGSAEGSPVSGEVGYLQVIWDRPGDQAGGSYYCVASALDKFKRSVSVGSSLQITSKDAAISDLVTYIAEHDKNISALSTQMVVLQQEKEALRIEVESLRSNLTSEFNQLEAWINNIQGHNVQTGSTDCSGHYVYFTQSFNRTPTVFATPGSFYISGYSSYSSGSFQISTSYVSQQSFYLSCSMSGAFSGSSTNINWLAIA